MHGENSLKDNTDGISKIYKYTESRIKYFKDYDNLTGLYSRQFLQRMIKKLDDDSLIPVAVVVGDINGLRFINNISGYDEGDRLLKTAANSIIDTCTGKCIAARWSGDEFMIIIPNTAEEKLDEILKLINRKYSEHLSAPVKSTICFGYEMKKKSNQNILEVLKAAEDSMYKYKYLEGSSFRSSIISSIKKTLFEKSHETEEHEERLKLFSVSIGKSLHLSDNQLHELELCAMLHDIGKIAVRDDVLNKPDKLNEEEWSEMKKHPEIGYRITISVPELSQVANSILCHHERFDGKGYPKGLQGEKIPLTARIVSVADAFDAMTSDRPYRKAMSREAALKEILKNSGTQFDPEIVHKFVESVIKA